MNTFEIETYEHLLVRQVQDGSGGKYCSDFDMPACFYSRDPNLKSHAQHGQIIMFMSHGELPFYTLSFRGIYDSIQIYSSLIRLSVSFIQTKSLVILIEAYSELSSRCQAEQVETGTSSLSTTGTMSLPPSPKLKPSQYA